jgi:mono/diheme cytochrome c family protein
MTRILGAVGLVCIFGLVVYGVLTLYDETMQVGRMWETPAIRPHEEPIPVMAGGIVPFEGGEAFYRVADPDAIQAPVSSDRNQTIAQGSQGYQYFCIHCHGGHYDGMGTVGQSFAPLPSDLRSAKVQAMTPGRLFYEISYGIPDGRQPALDTTIDIAERWQIVAYVKSLGVRK